jgi:hypothetical protein
MAQNFLSAEAFVSTKALQSLVPTRLNPTCGMSVQTGDAMSASLYPPLRIPETVFVNTVNRLSVRLSNSELAPNTSEDLELSVYLLNEQGEERLEKTWAEIMALQAPTFVGLESRRVHLSHENFDDLERQGWRILITHGHWPTEWREPRTRKRLRTFTDKPNRK